MHLNDIKFPLFMLKLLKFHLFYLPMLATLCFIDLFFYKIPLHRNWVRLKCVSYFLLDALFSSIHITYVSIFSNYHAHLNGYKERAFWETTHYVLFFVLLSLGSHCYCNYLSLSCLFRFLRQELPLI